MPKSKSNTTKLYIYNFKLEYYKAEAVAAKSLISLLAMMFKLRWRRREECKQVSSTVKKAGMGITET